MDKKKRYIYTKEQHKSWYEKRKLRAFEEGFCFRCGKKKEPDRLDNWWCASCTEKGKVRVRNKRKSRIAEGLCIYCPIPARPVVAGQYCKEHWFTVFAADRFGDSSLGKEIKSIYEKQNGLCIYSGEPLVLGKNASLDHKIPRCRGGTDDIDNLQWTTRQVNLAKTDFLHEEFVEFCLKVASKFGSR